MIFRPGRRTFSAVRRALRLGLLLLPPLAVVAMLAPPLAHSHGGHEHVPIADSEACAGGDVHFHAAHTHFPGPCPACAIGPHPQASPAPLAVLAATVASHWNSGSAEASPRSFPTAPRRSRAPPETFA